MLLPHNFGIGQILNHDTNKIVRTQSVYVDYNDMDGMNAMILSTVSTVKALEMMSLINDLQH
jgi:hypothetical protein